jgi:hypothetical protein
MNNYERALLSLRTDDELSDELNYCAPPRWPVRFESLQTYNEDDPPEYTVVCMLDRELAYEALKLDRNPAWPADEQALVFQNYWWPFAKLSLPDNLIEAVDDRQESCEEVRYVTGHYGAWQWLQARLKARDLVKGEPGEFENTLFVLIFLTADDGALHVEIRGAWDWNGGETFPLDDFSVTSNCAFPSIAKETTRRALDAARKLGLLPPLD